MNHYWNIYTVIESLICFSMIILNFASFSLPYVEMYCINTELFELIIMQDPIKNVLFIRHHQFIGIPERTVKWGRLHGDMTVELVNLLRYEGIFPSRHFASFL